MNTERNHQVDYVHTIPKRTRSGIKLQLHETVHAIPVSFYDVLHCVQKNQYRYGGIRSVPVSFCYGSRITVSRFHVYMSCVYVNP